MLTRKVCTLALVLKVFCTGVVVTFPPDLTTYVGCRWVLLSSLFI
jgi:hypothetical protein